MEVPVYCIAFQENFHFNNNNHNNNNNNDKKWANSTNTRAMAMIIWYHLFVMPYPFTDAYKTSPFGRFCITMPENIQFMKLIYSCVEFENEKKISYIHFALLTNIPCVCYIFFIWLITIAIPLVVRLHWILRFTRTDRLSFAECIRYAVVVVHARFANGYNGKEWEGKILESFYSIVLEVRFFSLIAQFFVLCFSIRKKKM